MNVDMVRKIICYDHADEYVNGILEFITIAEAENNNNNSLKKPKTEMCISEDIAPWYFSNDGSINYRALSLIDLEFLEGMIRLWNKRVNKWNERKIRDYDDLVLNGARYIKEAMIYGIIT
jgi:hypothetical protein